MAYEENYRELCIAIVVQVIEEYKDALRNNIRYKIDSCERWFRSDWCNLLSDMDGEYIINSVRKAVKDEKTNRRYDSKGIEEIYKTSNKESQYSTYKHW